MSALSVTPATRALLRLNTAGEPDPSGLTYWEVEETRHPDRTWYEVRHDGWMVAEVYDGPDGWRIASRPREAVPAAVCAELPAAGAALLAVHNEESRR